VDKLNYWFANDVLVNDVFNNSQMFFKLNPNELKDYLRNLWIKNIGSNELLNENSFSNRMITVEGNEIIIIKVPETTDDIQTVFVSIVKIESNFKFYTYTRKNNKRSNTINKYFYEFGECKNTNTYEALDQSYDESEEEFIGMINKYLKNRMLEEDKFSISTKTKFGFKWTPKDYKTISSKIIELAQKLVDLKLIYVEPDLTEEKFIVIRHIGLCKKSGTIDSLFAGLDKHDIYSNKFLISPTESIYCECNDRKKPESQAICTMQSCPIVVAGYLWYIQHNSEE
jgi:hypothetical protein